MESDRVFMKYLFKGFKFEYLVDDLGDHLHITDMVNRKKYEIILDHYNRDSPFTIILIDAEV